MTKASARPRPSVSRLRLTPPLPRSVGSRAPRTPAVTLARSARRTGVGPLAKPPMRRGVGTQARGIQRSPLNPRAKQQQDRIHRDTIRNAEPGSAEPYAPTSHRSTSSHRHAATASTCPSNKTVRWTIHSALVSTCRDRLSVSMIPLPWRTGKPVLVEAPLSAGTR